MPELHPFDVIGSTADIGGHFRNLGRRDIDEFGFGIDEPADQPRAGDAIDLGMLARHPLVLGGITLAPRRQLSLLPPSYAAFELGGRHADASQRRSHALADLMTVPD